MAVFTIVTTFADAVVASKRVNTSSSVLTRTVKTFVKIYNSNNRAKNNFLFVCLFVSCSFFVRHLRNTKLLQISVTGSFQLTNAFPKSIFFYCPLNMFLLKTNSIVGYEMIAYPTFQIVSTQLAQTRSVHGQSSNSETCTYQTEDCNRPTIVCRISGKIKLHLAEAGGDLIGFCFIQVPDFKYFILDSYKAKNGQMTKQKCEEMIKLHLRCSRSSESFLLFFFS